MRNKEKLGADLGELRKCPNGHGEFRGENICPDCGEITDVAGENDKDETDNTFEESGEYNI